MTELTTSFQASQILPTPQDKNGVQYIFEFNNGYSASVVRNNFSYGNRQGLWELAIMLNGKICYDTPITDDVIGYLSNEQVNKYLLDIAALPVRQ